MIVPVLLARLDSTRLPCKSFLVLPNGQTIIDFILSQLDCLMSFDCLTSPILATTKRPIDDPLAKFSEKRGLLVYRGSTNNVFARLLQAGVSQNAEYVMRINCDSPFIDESLVTRAIDAYRLYSPDVITNLMPRTYPYGITIQILKVSTLIDLINNCPPSPEESEHITPYIEKNRKQLQIFNIFNEKLIFSDKRLVVDTIEDYINLYMGIQSLLCSANKRARITWYDLLDTQRA